MLLQLLIIAIKFNSLNNRLFFDDFSFEPHLGYTEDAFLKEFEGVEWKVELVIG